MSENLTEEKAPKKRASLRHGTSSTSSEISGAKRVAATRSARRKAPTQKNTTTRRDTTSPKMVISMFIGFIIVSGTSMAIGMSDEGQIDVAQTMEERAVFHEARGNIEESNAIRSLETKQNAGNGLPNGGLVGAGNKRTRQQELEEKRALETAPETASSTDESASSTEEVSEEEGGQENTEGNTEESAGETIGEAITDETTENSADAGAETQ